MRLKPTIERDAEVKFEPQGLDIPLYRGEEFPWKLLIGCMFVAWLWHRPMSMPEIVVSCVVGGGAFWFVIGSSFSRRLFRHRIPLLRGLWFVVAIPGLIAFMRKVLPILHGMTNNLF